MPASISSSNKPVVMRLSLNFKFNYIANLVNKKTIAVFGAIKNTCYRIRPLEARSGIFPNVNLLWICYCNGWKTNKT